MFKVYISKAKSRPLDIKNNAASAYAEIEKARTVGANLVVFPQGFLTGVQLGILGDALYLRKAYNDTFSRLSAENPDMYILADLCQQVDGKTVFVNALYHEGKVSDGNSFEIDGYRFASFNKTADIDERKLSRADFSQTDCVIVNESAPVYAGSRILTRKFMKTTSQWLGVTVICALGGYGYTSHPDIYMPATGCFSDKKDYFTTTFTEYINGENLFDIEKGHYGDVFITRLPSLQFDIAFNQNPLVPRQLDEKEYCLDLFSLQSLSLATRMMNIGCKTAVVALSGGLDSALALLVTANAFDMIGLDRSGIRVISMPGFGTSATTKGLAGDLAASLGLDMKMIDITESCHQALLDIGHDGKTPDVTFENVQARMRTLNGLNLANAVGGIMVGTGDLSEVALGFSTYGGDHLASYGVNSTVSKTVIRTMLPHVIQLENMAPAAKAITDILNIPVSPELVPHGGEILQKTEEILAPYKLIDFFIYCFIVAKMSPIEMAQRASCVFEGEFSPSYLKEKAQMLCRRFITGQFKRSSAPEGARLTHVHLSGYDRSVPSDSGMGLFNYFLGE
ncbi:MAG: hypothetical protein IKU54_06875 [Oscillospiraceae bacterium]|nr:hypothetical protein [Oscillospiraceae bacterium]